jgi:hypothetical protein
MLSQNSFRIFASMTWFTHKMSKMTVPQSLQANGRYVLVDVERCPSLLSPKTPNIISYLL